MFNNHATCVCATICHCVDMPSFNVTRVLAMEALTETLDDLIGKSGISEKKFHDEWFHRMAAKPYVLADGWYSPPPQGMAILFGDRSNCRSLREQKYWSSSRMVDWRNDVFFAYASPVGLADGLPGDVSLTLYFGSNPAVREHFKSTYNVTKGLVDELEAGKYETSFDLVFAANTAFARAGCRNMVYSVTDPASINFGHTFPALKIAPGQTALTPEQREQLRMSRLYLNAVTKWAFSDHLQFTFQPELLSLYDPALPKVRYHYLARGGETFEVCRNVDTLIKRFDLI